MKISIHTPTKGATWCFKMHHVHFWFQSTLPRRERPSYHYSKVLSIRFQSTLPRRERQFQQKDFLQYWSYFNPHSHEGSDVRSTFTDWKTGNFNPHSHEGSDSSSRSLLLCNSYFNPHSHEGSDIYIHISTYIFTLFQSTLPRRERRQW